jgi:hypothetical protein
MIFNLVYLLLPFFGNKQETGQALGPWQVKKVVLNSDEFLRSQATLQTEKRSSNEIVNEMRMSLLRLKSEYMDDTGKKVDYESIRGSSKYGEYLKVVSQLKNVDLSMDDVQQRKAFFINLYNCLVIHSLVEDLLEKVLFSGSLGRLKLYATSSYNIGGQIFSLNDIENGVLRGNRPAAAPGSKPPFAGDDPRKKAMLACDPRIHFALNCGAMGCPAIGVYDGCDLDAQLDDATVSFVEGGGVDIDTLAKRVTLSMIFQWYKDDFRVEQKEPLQIDNGSGSGKQPDYSALLNWIKEKGGSPKIRDKLQTMMSTSSGTDETKIAVDFATYDWRLNGV